MTELATQFTLVSGVLATMFVGPGIAMTLVLRRKKHRRALRRSPINIDLLRTPGHTVRENLEEAGIDLTADVLLLCVIPLVALAIFLAQAHVRGLINMVHLAPVYAGSVAIFIAWMTRKLVRAGEQLDNLRAGFDAELAVGQELDQLMRSGAAVFHDFPAENFNIDHVVISTRGVFAVETKGYTKPGDRAAKEAATVTFDGTYLQFPTWKTKEPLEPCSMAYWQKLRSSGTTISQVRYSEVRSYAYCARNTEPTSL